MKIIKLFEQYIFEKKEKDKDKSYKYGCLMVYYGFPDMDKIHNLIDDDDIHDEGLETEPHTTLLYGLHDTEIENDNDVLSTALEENFSDLILYNASLFENEKYDVLKFDVKEKMLNDKGEIYYDKKKDVLYKINKELTKKFPYTSDFPDYHPHCTIGYLKPGTGKKYVKKLKDKEYIVKPKNIVYSKSDGEKIKKKIKKAE